MRGRCPDCPRWRSGETQKLSSTPHLHCDLLGDVSAAHVPGCGPAQIMEVQSRQTRLDACLLPAAPEISYWLTVLPREQAIFGTLAFDALEEQFPHAAGHRDLQSLFVLRRARFKANDVSVWIDLLHTHFE